MDRRAALDRRLKAAAVRQEVLTVTLSDGDEFLMRRLTNAEMIRVVQSAGDDDDRDARIFVNSFRFTLVDDDGTPLLKSYAEAAAFVNSLNEADFAAMRAAIDDVQPLLGDDEAVEAGKAS